MSESFKRVIQFYTVSPDVGVMHYIPKNKDETQPTVLMQINNRYMLLEKKCESKIINHEDNKSNQWILPT